MFCYSIIPNEVDRPNLARKPGEGRFLWKAALLTKGEAGLDQRGHSVGIAHPLAKVRALI